MTTDHAHLRALESDTIHSCSYFCERPGCMKAQRKELLATIKRLTAERDAFSKGHERYETVRRMNARQFADLYAKSLADGKTFDQRVDELRPHFSAKEKP